MWWKEPKYAWFIVSFLWLFGFLGSIGRFIVQYYQGPITEDLGVNRAFLGYAWSASILLGSLCAPIGGWLTDKFGYKTTMIAGSLLGVCSALTIITFPHPAGYFIGFGILGGLAGIGAANGYVIVNQWFRHHRAKALMIIGSAGSIGLAVLTPVFVQNESWMTWIVGYKISAAIGAAFVLLTILVVKERKHADEQEGSVNVPSEPQPGATKPGLRQLRAALNIYLHNPVLLAVVFALFTCGFSMGTVEMHLMAIQQTAHVSHTMFIASLSLLGLLELAGGFGFAVLLDRLPRAVALSSLYLIRAVAFSILFAHVYLSPVLFTVIFGATYLGAVPGGILLANESLRTKSIGLQTGFLLFFHQLGGVFAAIAGGLNYDFFQNYQALIALNIVFSSMSCAAYFLVRQRAQAKPLVA